LDFNVHFFLEFCLMQVLQALASCNHFINWISHKDDANKVDLFPRLHYSYSRMQYPMIAVVYRAILGEANRLYYCL
jgi:hypothetical protein